MPTAHGLDSDCVDELIDMAGCARVGTGVLISQKNRQLRLYIFGRQEVRLHCFTDTLPVQEPLWLMDANWKRITSIP